jgi:energy-converting hydrogenase Eha subunit F
MGGCIWRALRALADSENEARDPKGAHLGMSALAPIAAPSFWNPDALFPVISARSRQRAECPLSAYDRPRVGGREHLLPSLVMGQLSAFASRNHETTFR